MADAIWIAIGSINWAQVVSTGLVAAMGLFIANYFLDKLLFKQNRPVLVIEHRSYPVEEPIDLIVFAVDDPTLREELWNFRDFILKYQVYRLKIRNTGKYAAQNCKGVLNDGDDRKICWNIPGERNKMTINSNSFEYLDVCGILQSNYSTEELMKQLNAKLDKIGHRYANTYKEPKINEQYPQVKKWLSEFKPDYLAPLIIAPTENGWLSPPHLNWHLVPGVCKITVSAENAEPRTISVQINEQADAEGLLFKILQDNCNKINKKLHNPAIDIQNSRFVDVNAQQAGIARWLYKLKIK